MRSRHVGMLSAVALLLGLPGALLAQTGTVRGRVVDAASGQPLSDVQVRVENSTVGTLSGASGEYVLSNIPAGQATISARRVGYAASRQVVTVPAGGEVTQDFSLRVAAVTLDEVVVSGLGAATEKRALGNAVATVSGEEVSGAPAASSIDQALQGKIAGALISENSGQPGGGVSVRLRGTNSILGGAEPLYVVDGVIIDNSSTALVSIGANATYSGAALSNRLADLDPGDVERIEVLKGAAAAALYGSRANNGVIQIFTKRGREGERRISLTSEYGVSETPEKYDLNMAPTATYADVAGVPSLGLAVGDPVERFDYQDEIFRTGMSSNNHVSISGGSNGTTYFLSGGYEKEEGILRSSDYDRTNFRANFGQALASWLDLGVRANWIRSHADFIPEGEQTQGVLTSVVFTPTVFDPSYDPELGRYPYNPVLQTNPLEVIADWRAPEVVNRLVGGFELTAHPGHNLTLRYSAGLDDFRREVTYFQPPLANGPSFTGSIQNPVEFSRLFNNDLVGSHAWTPTSTLGLTSTVGFRYTSNEGEILRAAAGNLPPGQTLVGGAVQEASQSRTEFRTVGFFLEEQVSLAEQLYVTAGMNWDASSAFGEDERLQAFPRLGVSYVLGDTPWWEDYAPQFASSLRLRAAYGETGGQPPGLYSRFENYINTSYGGRPALVASITTGNPNLEPERQREYEAGFDAGFFDDRAQVEFTYYDKRTKNLVLSVPLPPSRGVQQQFQNIGELTNHGIELALNTVNISQPNFSWRSRFTYSANRNEVTKLVTSADTLLFGYLNYVIEGQPVGVFFGNTYARNADGSIALDPVNNLPFRGRDTVVVNGVTTTPFTRHKLGDPNPDFSAALSNNFTFGQNWELSFLLDGRFGNDVANFTRRITEFFGSSAVLEREASGEVPSRYYGRNPNGRISIYEEYVEDGTYVKLREIALQYQVPPGLVSRLGASGATLRIAGRNLYTWTDYTGLDPEVNLFSANTVARGVDFATTPLPRTFTTSLNLVF